jgi:hypothetical protein
MKRFISVLSILGLAISSCSPGVGVKTLPPAPVPVKNTSLSLPPTPKPFSLPPTNTPFPFAPTATPTSAPPTVAPGGFPRRFHVQGNAFVDQYGEKMIFRGMAPVDPLYQIMYTALPPDQGGWSEHHYQVMAEWGANIVRIPIGPDDLRNFINRNNPYEAFHVLDQTIAWIGENKMYAILDYHSIGWPPETPNNYYQPNVGAETSPTEMMNFWKMISKRYADNDVVAFYELFNEPETLAQSQGKLGTTAEWREWRDFMQEVIKVVRANDPDKIILVGGMNNAYDLSFLADPSNAIEGSNIAYATHPYSPRTAPSWDKAFGDLSARSPVFATELGYNTTDFLDIKIHGIPYHQAIIDYFEAHQISWTVWCFDAVWQTTLLIDNQNYTPSPSGEYFRSRMLELNQHP